MPGRPRPGSVLALPVATLLLLVVGACAAPAAGNATPPASTGTASPSPGPSTSLPTASASPTPSPTVSGVDPAFVPALSAIEMVGPRIGWAVGAYAIFATTDGQHWSKQLASTEEFVGVDFISSTRGWAVGARSLLATSDGGKTWQTVGEAQTPIRSVHFISAEDGWGIAGGANPTMNHGWLMPGDGGTVIKTGDGGMSWQTVDAPVDPQSLCFSDGSHGWLATSDGFVYSSVDGGQSWTKVLSTLQSGSGAGQQIVIECAAPSALWLQTTIRNGAAGHLPYVVYATQDAVHWRTVMTEPYTTGNQLPGVPAGPDSYPGSFSLIDPSDGAFVGDGPATTVSQCVLAGNGGATLRRTGSIANSSETFGAAFVSLTTGWVLTRIVDGDYVIAATSDGGYHWSTQLSIAASSAG